MPTRDGERLGDLQGAERAAADGAARAGERGARVRDRHERVEAERLVRAQDVEAGGAGAMADDQALAGRQIARRGADLGVGHAEEHDVRARAVGPAPERAQDATAGRRQAQRQGPGPDGHGRRSRSCSASISVQPPESGVPVAFMYPKRSASAHPGRASTIAFVPPTKEERREALKAVYHQAKGCTTCPQLAATRTTVVFGNGNADADLMFVGEAPGANEDRQGLPFVGQAGKLLDTLLGEIGLVRGDVLVANVLKCLSYRAMVQLGDGSWERIGRLVRQRYTGTVMSVDDAGRLVPRRVTGWHATPLADRSVYRLTYRSAKNAGTSRSSIRLTGDHPVLTERGYVRVDELRQTDRVATGQGLSELVFDVVCGTLLGDGSIRAKAAMLTMAYSERQAAYADFKMQLLAELRPTRQAVAVKAVAGGDRTYGVVHVRTRAHRALGILRRDFYRPKKVVPEWLGERLNERMLAFWFMDDGHTRIRPGGRQPLAEIASVSFTDADLQVLLDGLLRLGLPAKATRGRIYFDVATTRRLSELIAPYVPPVMRYKLHPDVAEAIPFEPSRFAGGEPAVMYDEVEVEDVTDEPRADRTFFCIDVEGTHNFVTAGGVVHNCRPPGNRDPHPAEIEACQDYLLRQVELIQPRVICTLGNFATKLLRGDPTGITRLHGREEVRVIGRRAVRLYPIFHPAAALYTPANVEVLRADFARLPELLALDLPPPAVAGGGAGRAGRGRGRAAERGRCGSRRRWPRTSRPRAYAEPDATSRARSPSGADSEAEADRELEPAGLQLGLF